MKAAILMAAVVVAILECGTAAACPRTRSDTQDVTTTRSPVGTMVAQVRRGERALERRAIDNDDNATNDDNQSTSCACAAVNCSDSGFNSAGCEVTCQPPGRARCTCGSCGEAGMDDGSANYCHCR